ncbi:hypothetical protein A6R68_14084 [Neotoma lepida]|uniref:PiggyBac transposable element-derived protein domain-containing protein n=1 Tax=Neotoma lepida TaxID=56216 RepID=A0A1A6HCM0_NEOLE|nr:hypothetical protein A6R68_14084 [Neotoma lepida]
MQGVPRGSRKGDILLLTWKDKRVVRMVPMTHDTSVLTTGKKKKENGEDTVKATCIKDYSAPVKDVDCGDQFLSCCSIRRKTMKWTKKNSAVPYKLWTFQFL